MQTVALPLTNAGKPRVEPRIRALVRASFRDSHSVRDCCVIDVSTRGLLVTTAKPPARGDFVSFQIGRNEIVGHVKWSGGRRFGVALQERVSPAAVVEGGNAPIALQKSVGQAKRKQGLLAALGASPDMLGRAVQLVIMLLCAVCAAYLIYEITGAGFEPMREAVMAMNAKG